MIDTIVIGAGLAGLVAALRLAEAGCSVEIVTDGVGGLTTSTGMVDILGYAPHLVERPLDALPHFVAVNPGHPYARVGSDRVADAVRWFTGLLGPDHMVGDPSINVRLPTALGVARPTALVPPTMSAGALAPGNRYALVGFTSLKDFFPRLAADNLNRARATARSVELRVSPRPGHADVRGLDFARAFDEPAFRETVASELRPAIVPGETVGLPAVVGLRDAPAAMRHMAEMIGAPCFEIPTLPPSLPGMRLNDALIAATRAQGVRMVMGARVDGAEWDGPRITGLTLARSGGHTTRHARSYVLASGGFATGGIEVDSYGHLRERALGLPLAGVPDAGRPRFGATYFDRHALFSAGVAVDGEMRPVVPDGAAAATNLRAAGAILTGAEPWREKSGEGICIASAVAAADSLARELR